MSHSYSFIPSLARLEYCLQLAAMLDSLLGVQHHHRVAADDSHPDSVPLPGLSELDGLVEDEVHEWVEAAEDALDGAVPVDLEVDPLVHELLQLGGMRLAAHDVALWDSGKTFR